MPVATRSQSTKMCSSPVETNKTLHYLLTTPLVKVMGVDKDALRMEGESCEDYIRRRGLPPINGRIFDKNNEESFNLHKKYLDYIASLPTELQYQYLDNNWISYDISLSTKAPTPTPTPFTNKYDKDGYTPLHLAVLKRDLALVKELLQVPGIDVNMYDSSSHHGYYASKHVTLNTALCMAKQLKYTEIEAELLKAPGINIKKLYC
jgi:ankyrin repeat protein